MKSTEPTSAWKAVRTPFDGFGTLLKTLLRGSVIIGYLVLRLALQGIADAWQALIRPPASARAAPSGEGSPGGAGTKDQDSADARQDRFVSAVMAFIVGAGVILGGLGGVIAYLLPILAPYSTLITYGLPCAWLIAAGVVGSRMPLPWGTPAPQNDHEKILGERPQETEPADPADVRARAERELCIVILQSVQHAHEKKRKGVHIAYLLDQLREEHRGFDEWDVTRLRKWCDGAGIPTNRSVKVDGSNPTWGIRYDELTTTLQMGIPEAIASLRNTPLPHPAEEVRKGGEEGTVTTPAAGPQTTAEEALPTTLIARHLGAVSGPSPGGAA
ncbi:hypothetical protein OG413_40995 [Streptomyces sp. NBC_01433]|uniref:hypothetical protein n=1 Tax=Streptomyces sp. NBC_01433 TaxID=2903864 RepID=UPI0022505B08|nr:hypothetical protein [Streptomyces sp. NBC_01433]MCX4681581.1 hypothetical protein [Streptomyces sp. NBC_01433]